MLPEVCELAQQVAWKEDASPWTPADKASHDFLVKALRILTPDVAVVSRSRRAVLIAPQRRSYWLINPLDLTYESAPLALIHP